MRLAIEHHTRYSYETPVRTANQILRLSPTSNAAQSIETWRIDAEGSLWQWRDQFGNDCHYRYLAETGHDLSLTARGIVVTVPHAGITADGGPGELPQGVYLRSTVYTAPDAALEALAGDHRAAILQTPESGLVALMNAVHAAVRYEVEDTHVTNTAAEALGRGHGVCQDHAHIIIAACRLIGLPARYVSGYLWAGDASEIHTASHAWAEALVPGRGWLSLDGANDVIADDRYVRLSVGLDYTGASPVSGIRIGGGEEKMAVEVSIRPLSTDDSAPRGGRGRTPAGRGGGMQAQQ